MANMQEDWTKYFSGSKVGDKNNWGGGTLENLGGGKAWYSAPGASNGGTMIDQQSINNENSIRSLASMNPGIAQQWKQQYGYETPLTDAGIRNAQGPAQAVHGGSMEANQAWYAAHPNSTQATDFQGQSGGGLENQGQYFGGGGNLGIGGGNSGGGYSGGGGDFGGAQWGKNPYIQQAAQAMTAQSNQNLAQNVMPGIRSGAQGAGQYGGSRQGIAEGVAAGNAQTGLNSALANMYSSAYGQDQSAALQNKSLNNSYDLGLRGNDLGFAGLDYNINQGNFQNQLAGANLGLSAYNAMMNGNQAGITAGNNIQQTPYNNWSNFNTAANSVGQGLASGSTTQTMPGNPFMGALGGYQLGSSLYSGAGNLGFPSVTDGGYSMGLGSAYGGNRQGM